MKLQALRDNIVLRPIMASNKTEGGIIMSDKFRERFEDGAVIVSIGPMVKDLAIGNVVIRPDPPRYEIIDDNTNEIQWISAEEDILAKLIPEQKDIVAIVIE